MSDEAELAQKLAEELDIARGSTVTAVIFGKPVTITVQ
jgi:hypothetical protein